MKKSPKQLERYLKGISNHRRIQILELVHKTPGISLESISEELGCNEKTISGHAQKLVTAGLLNKDYMGRSVSHKLSPYGERIYKFINEFD